jgi:hypothetical protein
MVRALLVAALLVGTEAQAQPLHVEGGQRVLTVSGEPLLAYHLVEHGQTVTATVDGPQVLSLMLRRHSRSHHGGSTVAALVLDGGEVDRFELQAQPSGRYLGGVGFSPGPRTLRQIKVGPGHHRIAVHAIGGAVVVAFEAEAPELQMPAAPLVAAAPEPEAPPIAESAPMPPAEPPMAPPARIVSAQPVGSEAPIPPMPNVEMARSEETQPVGRKHVLLELRGGSASQSQTGSTGWSAGLDARYFVSERFSVGVGADVYDISLASASVYSSPEAVSPLSFGMSLLAVPIVAEAAYDQPLGSLFTLTLGLGVGGDYQHVGRTLSAGSTTFAPGSADGVAPIGEALAGLAIRAPGGRVGLEVRLSSSLPQDVGGVASGLVVGAFLAEVTYQFLL